MGERVSKTSPRAGKMHLPGNQLRLTRNMSHATGDERPATCNLQKKKSIA
jgi:hypothetical protein